MIFLKECKKILFSITFGLYVLLVLAMYFSEFDGISLIEKPQPGAESYGTTEKEVPEIMMPAAIESLKAEYESGSFVAYPMGFYKVVRLTERKKAQMEEILKELSMENISYAHFRELMRQADRLIGGGSHYSDTFIVQDFSRVERTYAEALQEYEDFLYKDKVSGGYARLFCDYMGIETSILPVFLSVALCLKDKRARMEKLVFQKSISSLKLIVTRFAAVVFMAVVPVIFTAVHGTLKTMSVYQGYHLDITAFFRYMVIWILPNILLAAAAGMLLTELTGTAAGILVMGTGWFVSVYASAGALTGNITRFVLVVRHNSAVKAERFFSHFGDFIFNRIFYTIIAFGIVAVTIWVYEKKRGGYIHGYRKNMQNIAGKFKV